MEIYIVCYEVDGQTDYMKVKANELQEAIIEFGNAAEKEWGEENLDYIEDMHIIAVFPISIRTIVACSESVIMFGTDDEDDEESYSYDQAQWDIGDIIEAKDTFDYTGNGQPNMQKEYTFDDAVDERVALETTTVKRVMQH